MFEQLKKIKELQNLQNDLKKEKISLEKEGVKVTLSGNFVVEEIVLNPSLSNDYQAKILKDILNDAVQKVQLSLVQKFSKLT